MNENFLKEMHMKFLLFLSSAIINPKLCFLFLLIGYPLHKNSEYIVIENLDRCPTGLYMCAQNVCCPE